MSDDGRAAAAVCLSEAHNAGGPRAVHILTLPSAHAAGNFLMGRGEGEGGVTVL